MITKSLFILSALFLSFSMVFSQTVIHKEKLWGARLKNNIKASGIFATESAYGFEKENIQKTELIFKPEIDINLSKSIRWVIRGRLYSELADNLEPGKPNQEEVSRFSKRWLLGDRTEVELREFYFDIRVKKAYLTIGKQQIVWGKADGLRILDIVNPFNFREFIFDDFEDSRIPLWSINLELPIRTLNAQIVWIPDLSYHDFPDPEAAYSFTNPIPSEVIIRQHPLKKPNGVIQDSDIGLKLSAFSGGWDITLNYLYFYDDAPVFRQAYYLENNQAVLEINSSYERSHLAGTTFSNAFGKFTFRGEFGHLFNKYFSTSGEERIIGMVKANQIMGVAGFDFTGISNTTLSAQIFQDWAQTNKQLLFREPYETNFSLLISKNFLNETLVSELVGVQNVNRGEGFIRGTQSYLLRSNLKICASLEVIYGKRNTFLGQFKNQDRLFLGMELGL